MSGIELIAQERAEQIEKHGELVTPTPTPLIVSSPVSIHHEHMLHLATVTKKEKKPHRKHGSNYTPPKRRHRN